MNLEDKIEALLFWKNEPVSYKKLSLVLNESEKAIKEASEKLRQKLSGGITLLEKDDEIYLGTSKEAGGIIEQLSKEEMSKELSKAALETLSIILYAGPVKRSFLDYIRGVNSQFILRHLEVRGLVEKVQSANDGRAYEYKASFDLLSYLGLSRIEDLPEFDTLKEKIDDSSKEMEEEPGEAEPEENISEEKES